MRMNKPAFLLLALCALTAACDDDTDERPSQDAATLEPDASDETSDTGAEIAPDCFEDASTHLAIINACTEAEKVEKDPDLPLLLPDGGLPALP